MKKLRVLALTLSLVLAATACGNKESGSESTTAAEAPAGTGTGTTVESTEAETGAKASTDDSWVFKKGDVTIAMDAPSDDIIKALGSYQNTFEAPSCAFDGMDVVYSYPGYDVYAYTAGSEKRISGVVLRDDTVTTPEGIFIGSDQASVEKAYGKVDASSNNLVLKKGNSQLLIIFKDGVVSSIQYSLVTE